MSKPSENETRRASDRLALLTGLRAGGVILMLLGIWQWLGGNIAGHYGFGSVLFVAGAIGALIVPPLLAKRWKTRE